jgi:hypothetical protein
MSPSITIAADERQAEDVYRALEGIPNGAARIVSRAVNKVAVSTRARVIARVCDEINVKPSDVRNRNVSLHKASYADLEARIDISGRRIPLADFGARQTRAGVSYAIRKGQRVTIAHAFLATMPSGHQGVFIRKSAADVENQLEALRSRLRAGIAGRPGEKISERERGMIIRAITRTKMVQDAAPSGLAGRLPIRELRGPSVPVVVEGIEEFSQTELERRTGQELQQEIDTQVGLALDGKAGFGGRDE